MTCHTHENLYLLLADARHELRLAKDDLELARARAEQAAIDQAGGSKGLGANAEERERALILALAGDVVYLHARDTLRRAEASVGSLEAHVEAMQSDRRDQERQTRAKLCDALLGASVQVDSHGEHAPFGAALNQTVDRQLTRMTTRAYLAAPDDSEVPF